LLIINFSGLTTVGLLLIFSDCTFLPLFPGELRLLTNIFHSLWNKTRRPEQGVAMGLEKEIVQRRECKVFGER